MHGCVTGVSRVCPGCVTGGVLFGVPFGVPYGQVTAGKGWQGPTILLSICLRMNEKQRQTNEINAANREAIN